MQFLVIYYDNKAITGMFLNFKAYKNTIAYTDRNIDLTIARSIFFLIPPLLGYLIILNKILIVGVVLMASSFFSVLVSFYSYKKFRFQKKINKKNNIEFIFFIGILSYILHFFGPYALNILAYLFIDHAIWLVQLNPLVTSITTIYMVFYFDPLIAKKINNSQDFQLDFNNLFLCRLIGRMILFVISLIIIFLILK